MNMTLRSAAAVCALLFPPSAIAYELGNWDLHGTFSQGWIHSTENNFIEDSKQGTFDFREFGLNATTLVGERITLGGQVFGREFGAVGDNELFLDWLSASYRVADTFGLRVGKLKMPYGLYGETRDIDSLRTQVLLPQSVYVEAYRGSINAMWGVQGFGNLDFLNRGSFDYLVQYGQSAVDVDSGELNRLATYIGLTADNANDDEAGAMKLLWTSPNSNLRIGSTLTSSLFSFTGTTDFLLGFPGLYEGKVKDQQFVVSSVEYVMRDTTYAVEYLHGDFVADVMFEVLREFPFELRARSTGYYVSVDHQLTDNLRLGAGYGSYSIKAKVELPGLGASERSQQDGVYATLRYDVTPNLIMKLEQHFNSGTAALFSQENPDGLNNDWAMTLIKLTFVF